MGLKWYVVHTYSGHENKAKLSLQERIKQAGMDADLYTEFKPKVVTDLGVGYRFCKRWNVNLNCNNLLDVLPKWEFKAENASGTTKLNDPQFVQTQSNLITFNQRYPVTTHDREKLKTIKIANIIIHFLLNNNLITLNTI